MDTRGITLEPSEVTASINIKMIGLGWVAYVQGNIIVPAD